MAPRPKLTTEQIAECVRLYDSGAENLVTLGEKHSLPPKTIRGYIIKWRRENPGRKPPAAPAPKAKAPSEPPPAPSELELEDELPSDPESDFPDALPAALVPPSAMTNEEQRLWYSDMIRQLQADAEKLKEARNYTEARRVIALCVTTSAALQRLNKVDSEGGFLKISISELAARRAKSMRTIRAYLDTKRPLLCAGCNRELSIEWAKQGAEEPAQ